ncbi:hypothetical protein [Nostoc sp.]|uniref:hypothetical protein n=1 Tax=Nostoc sp. TaxID=1180 RepID=UPI002FF1CD24
MINSNEGESEVIAAENAGGSTPINEFVQKRKNYADTSRLAGSLSPQKDQKVAVIDPKIKEISIPIEQQRESARTGLSQSLLLLLTASLLGIGIYIFLDLLVPKQVSKERSDMHRELITLIWTSQVTLVGSALGFYFGGEQNKPHPPSKP